MPSSIRSTAMTKNAATPNATARIKTKFGMEGTCCANTCKSGSEIVMIKPMIKVMSTTMISFFERVMTEPVRSPIGVMDNSTPTLKKSIPTINRMAPIIKVINILGGIGAMEKHSNSTMIKIGSTAFKVSVNFSWNFERYENNEKTSFVIIIDFSVT